ncbi:helix-turn-helix domain-containing protein [Paenibacillus sp. FSL F4-0125]|uniref:helix-turn-helix domain-containing protein n=1 Tax=Paenibacillus sp. FSL F4-0125 TaxID=2954730 RepID=UPI004046ECB3
MTSLPPGLFTGVNVVSTNRSISEIAMNCGFQSASYFSSIFRNKTGLTPQNYRKKVRTPSHS